jgi:tRNA nucleotidyltransferase (CCA-adding enzyme)
MEIIVSHVSADFDAFAAMVAAKKLFSEARIIIPTAVNSNVRKFISLYEDELPQLYEGADIDFRLVKRVIIVDTRIIARTGPAEGALRNPDTEIIAFDHHLKKGKNFRSDLDYSRETGASTTILCEHIIDRKIAISSLEATLFMAGIYEDTGFFTYPGTTPGDLGAAAYLMKKQANLFVVLKFLNLSLTQEQHVLLEKLIMNSRKVKINDMDIIFSSTEVPEYVEGLSVLTRKLSQIEEISVVICWVKMKDKIYAVARSDDRNVDVSRILGSVGGGGHPQAASAVIEDLDFKEIEERIIRSLKKNIKRPVLAADIMSFPVRTVSQEQSIREVDRILKTFGHSGIPIVDKNGELAGIITRKDVDKAIKHGLSHAPVKGFRSHSTIKAGPNSSIDRIQNLMIGNGIGRVPIVSRQKIIGIITRKDILRYLHRRACEPVMELFPPDIRELLRIISSVAGSMKINVYLVGGIVRDALLDTPNYDMDIVVEGNGIEFGKKLAARLGSRVETYEKFMTAVLVLKNGQHIDIATSRVEYYRKPAELPNVESGSIKQDLARRDFTINALALSLNRKNFGEILDYFGGREDLKDRKIKVLHKMSFIEDPTRIFRAVRFEKRLNFKMDRQTEALARSAIDMEIVSRLTGVRIRDELIYILNEERPFNAVKRLCGLGALSKIGIKRIIDKDFMEEMRKAVHSYISLRSYSGNRVLKWRLLLAVILRDMEGGWIESWCLNMKIRKKDIAVIKESVEKIPDAKKTLREIIKEDFKLYSTVKNYPGELKVICHSWGENHAKNIRRYFKKLADAALSISGEDLKKMGYRPSPVFKKVLDEVLRLKLEGNISDRNGELAAAGKLIEERQFEC